MAVTAPANADEIWAGLKDIGFEVSQRVTEIDPIEMESSEDSGSVSGSSSWFSLEYESTY